MKFRALQHTSHTLLVYSAPKSCIPMTAKMKMMINRTKVRFDNAGKVRAMIERMSFKDFQDFASLKTLKSRNDLSIESPSIPSAKSSTNESTTITKSKMFQPS